MTEDLDALLGEARAYGIASLADNPNWLALPDGILIEVMQAAPGSGGGDASRSTLGLKMSRR